MDYQSLLECALSAVKAGGEILRDGFKRKKVISLKGFADPVTQFDKASEEAIVNVIQNRFPDHSILTEEELSTESQSGQVKWIVDPLDGTVNFTHSIPLICVSIGVEVEGEIVVGVIYNPIIGELFHAVRGKGAYLNGEKIHVTDTSDPAHIMVVTGFPYEREGRVDEVLKPMKMIIKDYEGFRRLGSAAIDMAYVACGRCDVFYEENLKPWDTAAGTIIVREAGGTVTDYYGEDYSVYGKTILASNGKIHRPFIRLLKDVNPPENG